MDVRRVGGDSLLPRQSSAGAQPCVVLLIRLHRDHVPADSALLLWAESPQDADGTTDWVNVALFVVALMLTLGSVFAIVALLLHGRWPALAGARRGKPNPAAALRQGALAGAVVGVLALLALTDNLDLIFVLVTILVAGLIEAYVQTRR